MADHTWHLVHIPVDFEKDPISGPYYDMVNWCIDNIAVNKREWICKAEMQVSNYWVFGFENEEDAVYFKMVFS